MDILYWFDSIRNPVTDVFFSAVTYLGHELVPIAIICIMYWCINKDLTYKIGMVFFASNLAVQCLKIGYRVPRPWVLDNGFEPVGGSKGAATSYSFPSGHTQTATAVYASFASQAKKLWVKALLILTFILVGISRLYLGVHTLRDVLGGMIVALIFVFLIFGVIEPLFANKNYDLIISLAMIALSVATMVFASHMYGLSLIDKPAFVDCVKTGGAGIAFGMGYYTERRYINFDVKAPLKRQIFKVIIGLGIALGLKEGLKLIIGESIAASGIRYFILVAFIVIIYPIIIKTKMKSKN